jgi:hypothetical protein
MGKEEKAQEGGISMENSPPISLSYQPWTLSSTAGQHHHFLHDLDRLSDHHSDHHPLHTIQAEQGMVLKKTGTGCRGLPPTAKPPSSQY